MTSPAASTQPLFARRVGSWTAILILAGGITLFRIVYLVALCPYSLIEDEAHYWEWSRRLDWSYYSKGPGIAWSIAASVRVLGETEWAIRMPVVVASAVAMLTLAALAIDIFKDKRAGFFAAACVGLVPMYQLTSLLATIDMPYAACWSVAAWAGWRALIRGSTSAWLALGAAIGVGFLFKYTILLIVPGIVLFAIVSRKSLMPTRGWPVYLVGAVALAFLGMVPVLVWNAQNHWPTLHHLLGHLGVPGGDMPITQGARAGWHYNPIWTLEFLGTQLGIVGPALALAAWMYKRSRATPIQDPDRADGSLFLLCCAAPVIAFYVGVTFIAEAEGNWAMAGYSTLMCLAGAAVGEGMDEFHGRVSSWRALPEPRPWQGIWRRRPETFAQLAWHWTLVYGIVAGLVMLRVDWAAKLPWIGPRMPVGRLTDAPEQAFDAWHRARDLATQTGLEPFYIAQHYGVASRLAYYIPGHPTIYCSSSRMNGRKTQYDFWPDTNLDDMTTLRGRPAVLVGAEIETWQRLFDRVESIGPLLGDHKKRSAFMASGYRGFPNVQPPK